MNQNTLHFPVVIERDSEGIYTGTVSGLRSCYTQAATLPELYVRLNEVIALCLDTERELFQQDFPIQSQFIGVQTLDFVV
jgi:predicted RNase H-like HicB family nuclease